MIPYITIYWEYWEISPTSLYIYIYIYIYILVVPTVRSISSLAWMFHLCEVAAGPHLLQAFHPRLQAAAELHHRGAVHRAAGLTPAEDQGVLRGVEEELLEPEAFPEGGLEKAGENGKRSTFWRKKWISWRLGR